MGLEGTSEYRVFVLDFEDFDVPRHYVGVYGKPSGHVFIEARNVTDAPSKPCIGGRRGGVVRVGSRRAVTFVCPNDSPYIERVARHGEGANVGHILIEWREGGVDYVASAHAHTAANLTLLRQLVGSVVLVSPGATALAPQAGYSGVENFCAVAPLTGTVHYNGAGGATGDLSHALTVAITGLPGNSYIYVNWSNDHVRAPIIGGFSTDSTGAVIPSSVEVARLAEVRGVEIVLSGGSPDLIPPPVLGRLEPC